MYTWRIVLQVKFTDFQIRRRKADWRSTQRLLTVSEHPGGLASVSFLRKGDERCVFYGKCLLSNKFSIFRVKADNSKVLFVVQLYGIKREYDVKQLMIRLNPINNCYSSDGARRTVKLTLIIKIKRH